VRSEIERWGPVIEKTAIRFALKLARRVGAARPEARRQILLRGSRICNGPCSSRCITPFEHRLESVGLPLECGFGCGELCLPIREKVPFDARGSQPFHVVRTERDQARRRAGIRRSTATILAVEVDAIGEAKDCAGMVPYRFEPCHSIPDKGATGSTGNSDCAASPTCANVGQARLFFVLVPMK
jgi:hypothetical protein